MSKINNTLSNVPNNCINAHMSLTLCPARDRFRTLILVSQTPRGHGLQFKNCWTKDIILFKGALAAKLDLLTDV